MKDKEDPTEIKSSTQSSDESSSNEQNKAPEVHGNDSASVSVSGNARKITLEDVAVAQNLIERCLQLYMNREEVVDTLWEQARIKPDLTTLGNVIITFLKKMEEENAEFFKAYYTRLALKDQINSFNQLLEHQYHLMKSPAPSKVETSIPMQKGIQSMPANNLPMGYSILQQPSIAPTGHPEPDYGGNVPSCHVVDGIPASENFHQMQINSGSSVDSSEASSVNSEMASNSPASFTSSHQSPTPTEISGSSGDTLASDAASASHMTSPEEVQLGSESSEEYLHPFFQMPWNISFFDPANLEDHGQMGHHLSSDELLDSPEQDDTVDDFFVDPISSSSTGTEESS